jgi:transcriptional regulator with XRE-family HTH domain
MASFLVRKQTGKDEEHLEIPGSFGDWLKSRRKALDLTQEELSARAGCSVFALRKIETGERRPSKQLAGLLADALEISEEDKPTFIRVARGDLTAERLQTSQPDSKPASPSPSLLPTICLCLPPRFWARPRTRGNGKNLQRAPCRLLTLTGMGGIGKTRLAIEFASRQEGRFSDGVHYVPLASINSAELIIPAIAEALDFSFSGPMDLQEQLFNYLATT